MCIGHTADAEEAALDGGAEGYGGASAAPELVVGSVKGNIGHLNTASGVAGLVKAALCRYNSIPPAAH